MSVTQDVEELADLAEAEAVAAEEVAAAARARALELRGATATATDQASESEPDDAAKMAPTTARDSAGQHRRGRDVRAGGR